MRLDGSISAALLISVLLIALPGCQKQEGSAEKAGPAEQAGKKIDKAVEKAGQQVDKAVEKAGQQIEKAGEAIQDAAKDDKK